MEKLRIIKTRVKYLGDHQYISQPGMLLIQRYHRQQGYKELSCYTDAGKQRQYLLLPFCTPLDKKFVNRPMLPA